jgi:predicted membrane chloride channel (bestrophin family)
VLRNIIPYLKLAHGSFNTLMMFLFAYQGWMGIRIRKQRLSGSISDFHFIKRHRKTGPVFAVLGCCGYIAGLTIVYIDKGTVFYYPLHLIFGSAIAVSIITTFFVSRKIKGISSSFRTPHFILGIWIICLYLVQLILGLGILLQK